MSPWEMTQKSGRVCSDKPWPGATASETWLCGFGGRLALHLGTHNTLPPLDLTGVDCCHSEEEGASPTAALCLLAGVRLQVPCSWLP